MLNELRVKTSVKYISFNDLFYSISEWRVVVTDFKHELR